MTRKLGLAVSIALCLGLVSGPVSAVGGSGFSPGGAGIGDPYFPMDGNRGYDAKHYFLNVRYNPDTDRLGGAATITARRDEEPLALQLRLPRHARGVDQGQRRSRWVAS